MFRTVCAALPIALRIASSTLTGLLPTISLSRYTWSLTVPPPRTQVVGPTLARPPARRPVYVLPGRLDTPPDKLGGAAISGVLEPFPNDSKEPLMTALA